jgi:hypothetical protein
LLDAMDRVNHDLNGQQNHHPSQPRGAAILHRLRICRLGFSPEGMETLIMFVSLYAPTIQHLEFVQVDCGAGEAAESEASSLPGKQSISQLATCFESSGVRWQHG